MTEVAIIGMACRFPDAPSPATLWANFRAGRVSFRELGNLRWQHDEFTGPARDRWRSPCTRAALLDDVDLFAARHFELSPRRAQAMDPQQRIMVELAREALQDAGYEGRPWARERAAVIVGASVSEHASLTAVRTRVRQVLRGEFGQPGQFADWPALLASLDPVMPHTMAGCLLNMCAAQISQCLDLGGPAYTLDAACASSLLAVKQAVDYLRWQPPGTLALAGGVYLLLAPENLVAFSKAGVLAERECLPYHPEASGFLLGEGAGLVVLKALAAAVADGDRIYAVIRGGAVNSDGYSTAAAAPNAAGQARVMRAALAEAGAAPADIGYVEGHGTGTVTGDQAELAALAEIFGSGRPPLGSAKANFGHTLTAAGIAGLLRAALALYHRTVPPDSPWAGPPGALVNAFGFGGTNSSLVLAGPPARSFTSLPGPFTVVAGADDRAHLGEYLALLHDSLAELPAERFGAWAHSVTRGRAPGRCRVAFRAQDAGQARRELTRLLGELAEEPVAESPLPPEIVDLPVQPVPRESYWQVKGRRPGPQGPDLAERWRRRARFPLAPSWPWLAAHRLRGRCLLPLAAGLDYLAWQAGLEPPWALVNIRVERPLWIEEPLWVEVEGLRLTQGRRLYLSAATGTLTEPPAGPSIEGPPPLSLADFYAHHAFHGPALQSLVEVTACSEQGAVGIVDGSCPPPCGRDRWTLDPIRLDGALQLALYWAAARRGRTVLPGDIDELVLLEGLGEGPLEVVGEIVAESDEGLTGQATIRRDGHVVAWVRGLRGRYSGALKSGT